MIRVDKRIFDSPGRPWPYVDDKPCVCMDCPECRGYVMDVRVNCDGGPDTSGWKPSSKDLIEQAAAMSGDTGSYWDEDDEPLREHKTYLRTYDDTRIGLVDCDTDIERRSLVAAERNDAKRQVAAQRAAEREERAEARRSAIEHRIAEKHERQLAAIAIRNEKAEARRRSFAQRLSERSAKQELANARRIEAALAQSEASAEAERERIEKKTADKLRREQERREARMKDLDQKMKAMEDMLANMRSGE